MNWNRSLDDIEWVFIGFFLLVYFVFFLRITLKARKIGSTTRSVVLKFFLRLLAFCFLLMALLNPYFDSDQLVENNVITQKDIYFLVDVSLSMNATDVQPSRLDKVKFELSQLFDNLENTRIGFIVFASQAFLLSPLTFDKKIQKTFSEHLNTNWGDIQGTNIMDALQVLQGKYANTNGQHSKLAVIISDGENFSAISRSILQSLRLQNIKIFCLGVGTENGSTITDNAGNIVKNEANNPVISRFNANTLIEISTKTTGKWSVVTNQQNGFNELQSWIKNTQSRSVDEEQKIREGNKYYYFLGVALLLLIIDVLVTVRTIKI